MSETIGGSYTGTVKQVCRQCNRTVYVVTLSDGTKVLTDPELMSVVQLSAKERVLARRVHGDLCLRYQSEAARIKAVQEAKRKRAL